MKKSIALAALLLALGTSVFAATTVKMDGNKSNEISFVALKSDAGFGIKIDKQEAGKSFVMIYDQDGNTLFKDNMTKATSVEKAYNISKLEVGDYSVEVVSNGKSVKKQMHVYEDNDSKSYFFYQ